MNNSVLCGLRQVADIYGRAPLPKDSAELYQRATGITNDEEFLKRLAELVKVSKTFPVPADFATPDKEASLMQAPASPPQQSSIDTPQAAH